MPDESIIPGNFENPCHVDRFWLHLSRMFQVITDKGGPEII
jgi:hypothetical protein